MDDSVWRPESCLGPGARGGQERVEKHSQEGRAEAKVSGFNGHATCTRVAWWGAGAKDEG